MKKKIKKELLTLDLNHKSGVINLKIIPINNMDDLDFLIDVLKESKSFLKLLFRKN